MKILTLFGTRPEIIRLSLLIKKLDKACKHVLVYTGQNSDPNLSDIFFKQLKLRKPDIHLGIKIEDFASQISQILVKTAKVLRKERPDKLLILGDTNSALGSIVAARMGIPVYHMEAGNRCYDDRVPEEINRRIIDHCSTILMPYTFRSRENLLREGISQERIIVTGNPILEVINANSKEIESSKVLKDLKLEEKGYFLVTLHRFENINEEARLKRLISGLNLVAQEYKKDIIVSLHPHTADKISKFNLKVKSKRLRLMKPMGFLEFIKLEKNAYCVLSDSGTVQEECCILKVANATLRDVTERPETIDCGSNILTGSDPKNILETVKIVTQPNRSWVPPAEYLETDVSSTVLKIVLGR
ncbi:MAG: UDP-N-acetylglucosamine 2-epimerase (non-hydrolyzing) [Candidatus Omnitrophica bacterium]|nr:UDP-N-acetylglucosamine 2-epimerase (non-hydrolyzing) [Candidatus Omnitrophota bacterium]